MAPLGRRVAPPRTDRGEPIRPGGHPLSFGRILRIDAETGEKLDQFAHVSGGKEEDIRLQAFFH